MKKAVFAFSTIVVILLISSTVVFAKPLMSNHQGASMGECHDVLDISHVSHSNGAYDNDGFKPPLNTDRQNQQNNNPQENNDVSIIGVNGIVHTFQHTVTLAPPSSQTAIGDYDYNSLSEDEQGGYISVGEGLWVKSSDIGKLVDKGLIEAIGMNEYNNLSEEERDDYIMASKSFWVSKTNLYQLFRGVVN